MSKTQERPACHTCGRPHESWQECTDAVLEKIDRAEKVVAELCKGERRWVLSIPARPNHDPDWIIGGGLLAARDEIARLARELEEARACCKWEEDKQRRALEYWDGEYGTTLAEEFPYGCDTIEHVAEALIVARRELEEARERERALRDDLTAAIGHLSALVDLLHHDGYPEHSDHAASLVSAAERYLESPSREQEVGAATPQGEAEVVTQAEIEARWLEYVAAREALIAAAFNAGSCASLHDGVHRDDIDRQGRARDRLDAAVRTLAALLRSKAEDRATPTDRSESDGE